MQVRVQPADYGGCGMYRLRWPAAALADLGYPVTVHDTWPEAHWRAQTGHDPRIISVDVDADVVVMQRPMLAELVQSIPVMQRQGVAVVVEVDDDFTALPRGHQAREGTAEFDRQGRRRTHTRRHLRRACELADLVTCTTPAIAARYAPHGRAAIIPNCVPARYLTIQPEAHDGLRVGWTGSTVTHVDDLASAGDGIARALDGAPFHVVGTGVGVADQLSLGDDQVIPTGWVEIDDYPTAYAGLDIAVVPLVDNDFNHAKSWLKGIEAAALGVPFVASVTDPYCDLAALGAGGLARTPDEWVTMLRLLIDSPEARAEIAWKGRQVAAGWTIEGQAWRWAEAWEQAVKNRRQKAAA
jgi:glycosyltransferase involved in cell wall biosynthesis